jgi:TonB family protein
MKLLLVFFCLIGFQTAYSKGTVTSQLKPIITIAPKYPTQAVFERIEGFVDIQFTVDVNGSVKNVHVLQAEPENIFNQAAIQAISRYKFSPQRVDNVAVEQMATQRIGFKLSAELSKMPPSPLEKMAANKPSEKPFMAVYSLTIDKPNKSNFVDVIVTDKRGEIDSQLLTWHSDKSLIPHFESIQENIIKTAQSSLIKSYGAFNQYQKICVSTSCPPTLISQLNTQSIKDHVKLLSIKVELKIDEKGKVTQYKIKKRPRKLKNTTALKQMVEQMKFLPATKHGKPISSKIIANIKAFEHTQVFGFFLWGLENIYLLKKQNWVRVSVLINKKGKVLEAKAIDSSDKKFEKEAVKAVKNQKFNKNKSTYQLIKRIDFELTSD